MGEAQHGLLFPLLFLSKFDALFMGSLAYGRGKAYAHMCLDFPAPSHCLQEGLQANSLLQASDPPFC